MAKISHFFKNTPVEGNAIEQLKQTSELAGMKEAVGMPDLHLGKGHPIGASFLTDGIIYPYLVGNDIGCGMNFAQLDLKAHKVKRDKLVRQLGSLEGGYEGDISDLEMKYNIKLDHYTSSLGTLGGGNHFLEIQTIESVENKDLFNEFNLDKNNIFIMTHSGSRGLGESILSEHIKKFNSQGLKVGTPEFENYIKQHDYAVLWAKANRDLILKKACIAINADSKHILDIVHNSIQSYPDGFIHRKGTAPSDQGLIVIPGSRGDFSYLVKPKSGDNLKSLAHGAGRKWKRGESKSRLSERYSPQDLLITDLKSQVICEDKELLYEEAPENYKKISRVIQDLFDFNLIDVVAILRPIVTYKKKNQHNCDE
jgi:release factor H-coupled RctB family protein